MGPKPLPPPELRIRPGTSLSPLESGGWKSACPSGGGISLMAHRDGRAPPSRVARSLRVEILEDRRLLSGPGHDMPGPPSLPRVGGGGFAAIAPPQQDAGENSSSGHGGGGSG